MTWTAAAELTASVWHCRQPNCLLSDADLDRLRLAADAIGDGHGAALVALSAAAQAFLKDRNRGALDQALRAYFAVMPSTEPAPAFQPRLPYKDGD